MSNYFSYKSFSIINLGKMTEWRYKERLYDLTLSIKFYSKVEFV
ncbi:hypothetical protein BANRA_03862 [Klebsiella variicola]|nr:hypothetical protein BANRA_03862 [Klebsiella variicola]